MRILALVLVHYLIVLPVNAGPETGIDEQAQLPFWGWQQGPLFVRFVQRLPDQSRAYFAGRGFEQKDVELIASHCIFQSVFKNVASVANPHVIEYDLSKWIVQYNGNKIQLKRREEWQSVWEIRKTPMAQKIAFEWSLLPTQQRYQPADFNWGMMVLPLPHGAVFDLQVAWQVDGKPLQATIKNMQCAKDVYISTQAE